MHPHTSNVKEHAAARIFILSLEKMEKANARLLSIDCTQRGAQASRASRASPVFCSKYPEGVSAQNVCVYLRDVCIEFSIETANLCSIKGQALRLSA